MELSGRFSGLSLQPSSTSGKELISERFFRAAGIDDEHQKASHLRTSMTAFNTWASVIKEADNHVICFEDGEADDQWQNLLMAERGATPELIFHRGGAFALRNECIKRTWEHLNDRFQCGVPPILPIHGSPRGRFTEFDEAEGQTLFTAEEIGRLVTESAVDTPAYEAMIEASYQRLVNTLETNHVTVVVLKTAPTGLARALKEHPHLQRKVIAIWVGPMTEPEEKNGRLMARFNYYQDFDSADDLLAFENLRTIIVSPLIGGSQVTSVIDKSYMPEYRRLVPDEPQEFGGFDKLAKLGSHPKSLIAQSMMTTTKRFRNLKIEAARKWKEQNDPVIAQLEAQIRNSRSRGYYPSAQTEENLAFLKGERAIKVTLGEKWDKVVQNTGDNFVEYCPIDPAAEQILDSDLRADSVTEAILVRMERNPNGSRKEIMVTPDPNGHIAIISGLRTNLSARRCQNSIYWMVDGEKRVKRPNQWVKQ